MKNSAQITDDNIDIEVDVNAEAEEDEQISSKGKIYTDKGDPEIISLYNKFKKGKLNVQPTYQRYFVWDSKKSSKLIESVLLDIPLPVIYLSEENGGENVVDGQQRLTSFFSFIDGKFPDGSDFKLSKLSVYSQYSGLKFSQLPDNIQDKIQEYKIRTITFLKDSDKDLQFEIFERLNTGSVSLNDQELRNCIYRGEFNELLKELASYPDFRYLLGLTASDSRMKDVELVLRFTAFYLNTYLKYRAPIKLFLNHTMLKHQNIGAQEAQELRNAFKNATSIVKSLLDRHAFKRFYKGDDKNMNGRWEPQKFNVSLFDILMNTFANRDKNTVYQNLDRIREGLIDLMTSDQEFIDSIELSTSSLKAVTKRFDKWRNVLDQILGVGSKEPRCFTQKLKEDLFNQDSTCAICGNKILTIDDASVDHIKQYWTGGQTIPENARLTHRYCNMARSRTDVVRNSTQTINPGVPAEEELREIDSAKAEINGTIYYLKRYENDSVKAFDENGNQLDMDVKPLLRRINDIYQFNIGLTYSTGADKNTRHLGREIISALNNRS